MSQNPGWLTRVFGGGELEEALAGARVQLAARERRIEELEQQLIAARDATGASERERELAEKLALAIADRTTLAADHAELQRRLTAHESALASEAERATTLGKAATAANRRAEQRLLEIQALEKQRDDAATSAAAAKAALEPLEAALAGRERELSTRSDALTAAEWKIETLERELEQARVDVQRAKGLQQTLATLQRELSSQRAEREQQDRALAAAQASEAALAAELASARPRDTALRDALRGVIELSAHALHLTLGAAAHLALELGAERVHVGPLARGPSGAAGMSEQDAARRVNEQLALLGVADELRVRRDGERVEGAFHLRDAGAAADAAPLARWVAAYAVEALGVLGEAPLRVEAIAGGPSEFRFSAAPRTRRPGPRPQPSGAREAVLDGEQPSSGD